MKHIGKKIISVIAFTVLLLCALMGISSVLQRKQSYQRYGDFFEQEQDFDILFFGSSHMINGVLPMELWDEQGMISYNMGGFGNQIPTSYWVLKNALDYTTPQLVVVDVHYLSSNSKIRPSDEGVEQLHTTLDAFPLTVNKIKSIFDLLDGRRKEFLWNFIVYHERWDQLTGEDFYVKNELEKGALARIAVNEYYEFNQIEPTDRLEEETIGQEYLKKIIELCQTRGIEVLLVYIPYIAPEEEQRAANAAYEIAEEYNINYINFMYEDIVNFDTDCSDNYSHLNAAGAQKVTHYLGEYIKKNYNICNRKQDENFISWHDDYEEYKKYKIDHLKAQTSLYNYLMLLYDDDFRTSVQINLNGEMQQCEMIQKLLRNIEGYAQITYVNFEGSDIEAYITVQDPITNEMIDSIKIETNNFFSIQRE